MDLFIITNFLIQNVSIQPPLFLVFGSKCKFSLMMVEIILKKDVKTNA